MWKKSLKRKENLLVTKRWQPIATKQRRQSTPQSYLVFQMSAPIDQWKLNDIPAFDCVMKGSLSWRVSNIVPKMLRHHGHLRENDGAIDWNPFLPTLCRDFDKENVGRWPNTEWLNLLQRGSDKENISVLPGF